MSDFVTHKHDIFSICRPGQHIYNFKNVKKKIRTNMMYRTALFYDLLKPLINL